jgi:hypothetical protein
MFIEHVSGDMSLFWGSHAIKNVPFGGFEWDILFPKIYMVSDVDRTLKAFRSRKMLTLSPDELSRTRFDFFPPSSLLGSVM